MVVRAIRSFSSARSTATSLMSDARSTTRALTSSSSENSLRSEATIAETSPSKTRTSRIPTPGLPGYETITLTAVSSEGTFIYFNFLSYVNGFGEDFGLFGSFNQLSPLGLPTVWGDVDPAIYDAAGMNPLADSHFLPTRSGPTTLDRPESTTSMGALWLDAGYTSTNALPFAQVVQKIGEPFSYVGEFSVQNPFDIFTFRVSGSFISTPEPAAISLAACGLFGVVAIQRRRFMPRRFDQA